MKDFINEWLSCGTLFSTGKGQLILGWGEKQWSKDPHPTIPSFYFPDYFLKNDAPWFVQANTLDLPISQLLSYFPHDSINQSYSWNNPYQQVFNDAFHDLQAKIASAELAKAVPFIIESVQAPMGKAQLTKSLKTILNYALHNPAHLYGFWNENEGMLGATPEVLFLYEKEGVLETMACAGTKNIHENHSSLLSDPKELHEHELVVKGITQSLSPYGKVTVGEKRLLKLTKLMHLVTPLTIHLEASIPFQEIVTALHPTPALGAFPKKEGQKWLENYQKLINRNRFGAPAGFLHPEKKQSNCFVAIRNVQWNHEGMQIAAGCGVVADSKCENEWAEIGLKLKAIKEMLAL